MLPLAELSKVEAGLDKPDEILPPVQDALAVRACTDIGVEMKPECADMGVPTERTSGDTELADLTAETYYLREILRRKGIRYDVLGWKPRAATVQKS